MAPSDQWRQEGESLVLDLEFGAFEAALAFVRVV